MFTVAAPLFRLDGGAVVCYNNQNRLPKEIIMKKCVCVFKDANTGDTQHQTFMIRNVMF
jgi:hypothetical protein